MDNLRLSEMLAKGEITETGELTDGQREFLTLHGNICRKGAQVVVSMVDFASELKEMRDKKLYANAGYESFGAYCERAVGLKESMAYRYVKVYEELPRDFLYLNEEKDLNNMATIICSLKKEWQIIYVQTLISKKVSFEIFKKLDIFGHPSSWAGSEVTMYDKVIEAIDSFLTQTSITTENISYVTSIKERRSKVEEYKKKSMLRELSDYRFYA